MHRVISKDLGTNLYILVMKQGHFSYYGNANNPFRLFRGKKEAEQFITNNRLGALWRSTKATPEILADYFRGNL